MTKPVATSCLLHYLGVKFVDTHLTDVFYCHNDQPGLSSIYYQNMCAERNSIVCCRTHSEVLHVLGSRDSRRDT